MSKKKANKSAKTADKRVFGKRESSILLFILVLACLIFIGYNESGEPYNTMSGGKAESTGKALIGGTFELTDQNGAAFSSEQLKGKKSIVFFGFTHCPAVCPTAMAQISAAMETVDADKVQPVFITVDPERDNPEVIKAFLVDFYPNFIGLTGDAEALKNVQKEYKVYSAKGETPEDGNYNMDHSSIIYLMDENGEYLTHFTGAESTEEMAARITNSN
jgi:protein SCO1/2